MGVAEEFAPSFLKKPQLRQEDDGNRLIFECQLLSSPKPEIEWYRSDNLLTENERTKFKIQPIGDNKFTVILELDDVIETDAGLYKVKAKNKAGEVSASINLNFRLGKFEISESARQIDGFAPTFAKRPAIRQEDDGKRLLFECQVNADPVPTVSWFHNGNSVKESSRHKTTVQKDGHSYFASLEIKNVTVEDAGKYKVNAKNELGESNATISLNFDSDEAPVPEDGIKPTFTERPVIRQSEDGGNVTFECRCVGDPKPTVTWYHGQEEIKEGGRYIMSLSLDQKLYYMARLEISSVMSSDQGEYRARATNQHGEGLATINLSFESGSKKIPDGKSPRFPKKPTIRQDDDILIMECILEAHPVPDVTWHCADKKIEDSKRAKMSRKSISKEMYVLTLEILNPTTDDGGNYRCNAVNMYGESNANIALNFQGVNDVNGFAPSFIEKPRIIPNESGTLITMKCKCKAKPEPTVRWYRGTQLISEGKKLKIKSTMIAEDTFELTLEIQDPGASDGGTYRCNVQNEYGESNANLNLNIEADPEPEGEGPTFIEKPRIVSENQGKLVIMECKVKAEPKPDIIWYRNGHVIQENSKIKMFMEQRGDQYYIKLELIDPQLEDSGLYKCNIKNTLGELNANLTLNIEIVPVIKDKPKIIKIINRRAVVIECTVASKFEPKCTWYKEETAVNESKRHAYLVEQTKEGEFAVKLEINEVEETDKGSYKLIARNEKGEAVSQIVQFIDIPEEERKPTKPELVKRLADQTVTEAKSFELLISLKQSDRKCKIEWYKGVTLIKETKEITTTFDGVNARLTFSTARQEHSSNYKVVVINEAGKTESICKITVAKKDSKKKDIEKDAEEKRKEEEEAYQPENEVKPKETKESEFQEAKKEQNVNIEDKARDVEKEDKKIIEQFIMDEQKKSHEHAREKIEEISEKPKEKKPAEEEPKEMQPEITAIRKTERKALGKKQEITIIDDGEVSSRRSSFVQIEQSTVESRKSSIIEKAALEKPENKTFEANKSPKQFKEEIPKLKFAEKRNIPKQVQEEKAIVEELPKLRKTSIATPKEESKQEPAKTKAKAKPKTKPKYEELPEIPDYERPVLEKYEKSDFEASDFGRELDIPSKMDKPVLEIEEKAPEKVVLKNGVAKKENVDHIPVEQPQGHKVGKGKIPEDMTGVDSASLRPVIIEPEAKAPKNFAPAEDGSQSLKGLINQRRRSSVRNLMPKEPIENESFLGVVLKPVTKDLKDEHDPQQTQAMLKETVKEGKMMSAPGKTKIYVLKKPEGLPISVDKYKRPDIEKYEEMEFEKSKKDKLENKDEPKSDILKVQTSVPQPSKDDKPTTPKIQPPAPGEPPKIEVVREKRPSLAPEPASRRGSLIPPEMGRRPSLIINDEKKLRPGEVADNRVSS
ncbi:muscle M-line assembly protein unc-89-like isoform X4 [Ceratitis capitata]|uniref:muscle M-line assembly protein unc-89-like isoform X4 n=1 Tax=Ceratitis capitata TaxID=7213 RepID=UPI000C6C6E0E|nr:muscle M-line assembly protein unc-89-like isoform X4 [Ceratitis capitata]